jgi:Uma2 family endonuclease
MATTKPMTVEEFAALPDDGWRYELIEGVLHRRPAKGIEQGMTAAALAVALREFVRPRRLGLVGFGIGFILEREPPTLLVPDLAFARKSRLPPLDEWANFPEMPPDLAVEVVSQNDEPADVAVKVTLYLVHGVPLVWVVYPRPPRVVVHQPGREARTLGLADTLDGGEILPGFRLPMAGIFD